MNNKVNYTLIGLSVLIATAFMFAFSYWMLKPTVETKTTKYNIYFDESVLGLNIDAPVKYRGISVGKVTRLRISPYSSEQVEVLITILSTTPIKENTEARLTAQGITGLSYINLSMGEHDAPALVAKDDQEYPVIKSVASFFEDFEKSLDSVSSKLSKTLTKTSQLLNDDNQEQINLLLHRSASFMDRLDRLLDEKTVRSLQRSIQNVESASSKVDGLIPKVETFVDKSMDWEKKIENSFDSIMNSYLGIRGSMDEIKRAVSSGEFNVKEIAADIVPTMNNTLLDMQELMIKVQDTLEQYDRSPGDILFKQEDFKKAPGEN
ncbi:MAG: MlaD family protein [Campylobacterota bacterium]|nr:MlaD family protein [Campylobacterota bacterium]